MLSSSNEQTSLWPLLLATLVVQSAFGTILPLLPLFVKARGLPLSWLGIMAALYALVAFVGQLFFGRLSDIWGRRRFMLLGTALSTLGTLLFLIHTAPIYFLGFRALQGLGVAAFLPAANALVADRVPSHRRGRAFALLSSFYMAGFAVGPMIGGLASAVGGLSLPFEVGVVLGVIAIIAVLFGIRESSPMPRSVQKEAKPHPIPWNTLGRWLVLNFGWMGLGGMYDATWSIYMDQLGASHIVIGLSWTLFALPYLLFNFLAGRLADKAAWRSRLIYGGALLNGIIVLLYVASDSPSVSIALSVLEAVSMSLITPSLNADVMSHSQTATRGQIQGLFQSAGTLGSFFMALASGYLLPYGPKWALLAGACVLFLSVSTSWVWGNGATMSS
ncbi:MFS transporter [Sulfobacillus sp. hq2]|uniref:MFS transporter n=1 Tax=Sulfobacillus sp. hq2 TaxID=2039167 RepID=UPI000CD312DE|nr:MFS transporter [Sulfobacillus sp. hq2]POB10947.1 MFS transporter [Sulfobacillus sp. hq2]